MLVLGITGGLESRFHRDMLIDKGIEVIQGDMFQGNSGHKYSSTT